MSGWTDAEKYSFLLQAMKQFSDTKAPSYDKIKLPGRTPKAMSHQWTTIRKQMAAIQDDGSFAEGAGPAAAAAGPSEAAPKTPTKRGAPKANGSATKKAKTTKQAVTPPPVENDDEDQQEVDETEDA